MLHAPLFWVDWRFDTGAVLLRATVLAYLLAAALAAGLGAWLATRNAATALISTFLPRRHFVPTGVEESAVFTRSRFMFFLGVGCGDVEMMHPRLQTATEHVLPFAVPAALPLRIEPPVPAA